MVLPEDFARIAKNRDHNKGLAELTNGTALLKDDEVGMKKANLKLDEMDF
jgi:hypothetical protein